jgi:hypothetical protein
MLEINAIAMANFAFFILLSKIADASGLFDASIATLHSI